MNEKALWYFTHMVKDIAIRTGSQVISSLQQRAEQTSSANERQGKEGKGKGFQGVSLCPPLTKPKAGTSKTLMPFVLVLCGLVYMVHTKSHHVRVCVCVLSPATTHHLTIIITHISNRYNRHSHTQSHTNHTAPPCCEDYPRPLDDEGQVS